MWIAINEGMGVYSVCWDEGELEYHLVHVYKNNILNKASEIKQI